MASMFNPDSNSAKGIGGNVSVGGPKQAGILSSGSTMSAPPMNSNAMPLSSALNPGVVYGMPSMPRQDMPSQFGAPGQGFMLNKPSSSIPSAPEQGGSGNSPK